MRAPDSAAASIVQVPPDTHAGRRDSLGRLKLVLLKRVGPLDVDLSAPGGGRRFRLMPMHGGLRVQLR